MPQDDQARAYAKSAPEWTEKANIYEVNIRQYTPEGTINAFRAELGRLQDLGVKILWIMPVQPIGEKERKGGLGSYYSIRDYTAVNPEFGSLEDFAALVDEAHQRGMKVILDWVANHTAWDHHWIYDHPEWYSTNEAGEIIAPVEDWSDVADLNYEQAAMRKAMQEAMAFWIKEADIDGFRCDVAMMVPMDFWNETRAYLDSIKPVFMLAEAEGPEFHEAAFDMTYAWDLHHHMNKIAKGEEKPGVLSQYRAHYDSIHAPSAFEMAFITNHDENSWNGTVAERMGDLAENFFVLSTSFKSCMPLIYSGQEAGLNHRLAFFEKDSIDWSDTSRYDFYRKMLRLKADHPALENGAGEGDYEELAAEESLFAYRRSKAEAEVLVYLNFGASPLQRSAALQPGRRYRDYMSGELLSAPELSIPARSFRILTSVE